MGKINWLNHSSHCAYRYTKSKSSRGNMPRGKRRSTRKKRVRVSIEFNGKKVRTRDDFYKFQARKRRRSRSRCSAYDLEMGHKRRKKRRRVRKKDCWLFEIIVFGVIFIILCLWMFAALTA